VRKRLTSGAALAVIIAVSAAGAATAIAAGSSGISAGDKIRSFAGIYRFGTGGFSGDGGPAAKAQLSQPTGVAIDKHGNVYIADTGNQRIRKVAPGGTITTVAGGGPGVAGDVIPAAKAHLDSPLAVAVNAQGDVYISLSAGVIWRLTGTTLTRFAGSTTNPTGVLGDGGPATNAELSFPSGMTVDPQGNLLIADTRNNRIRKVSPGGTITTFAGTGVAGDTGDGGPATKAELDQPADVAVDAHGNVYIADRYNAKIRKVSPNGTITTIAGNGKTCACQPADGTRATATDLADPFSVIADTHGNVFFTNLDANIEEITPDGKLTRVAGLRGNELSKGSGDGGPANRATLAHPVQMAFDRKGNLYVAVVADATIREIQVGTAAPKPAAKKGSKPTAPVSVSGLRGRWVGSVHQTGATRSDFQVVLTIRAPLGKTNEEQLTGICVGGLRYVSSKGNTYTYSFSSNASNCSSGRVRLTQLGTNRIRYDWDGAGSISTGILSRRSAQPATQTSASADQVAIIGILDQYQADFAGHDAARLASLFTPDITRYGVVPGGCGTLSGRSTVVQNYVSQFPQVHAYRLVGLSANEIRVNGSVAQVHTRYQISGSNSGTIQFTLVRKTAGWRISSIRAQCPV
jgi:sugar lactone lactonase YvrE